MFFPPSDFPPPPPSVWARIKAAILRATPATPDPAGDRHVTAWIQQRARENDNAMPPAVRPPGMHISPEALKVCSAPSPAQHDFTRHLESTFPRTGNTEALLSQTPRRPAA
jgi:hypothetical protein